MENKHSAISHFVSWKIDGKIDISLLKICYVEKVDNIYNEHIM